PDITVALHIAESVLRPREALTLDVTVANAGTATAVDAYFGIRVPPATATALGCADGVAILWLDGGLRWVGPRCLAGPLDQIPRLARRAPLPGGLPATWQALLRATVPADAPAGDYMALIALTVPDALAAGRLLDPADQLAFTVT